MRWLIFIFDAPSFEQQNAPWSGGKGGPSLEALNRFAELYRDTWRIERICKMLQMAPSRDWREAARKRNPELRSAYAQRDVKSRP